MAHSEIPTTQKWKEIVATFLKLGLTAYGGPAIMGIMQTELQERRQWVTKERFMEGLTLVNMLPGAAATQLGIYLGYMRGGWWGGLLAGLCFVLPAFFIMLALTLFYAAFGATPLLQGALYGLGPVVLGIFLVAIYRMGRTALTNIPKITIAIVAALLLIYSPLDIVTILAVAGGTGVSLFHSKKLGILVICTIFALISAAYFATDAPSIHLSNSISTTVTPQAPGLLNVGWFFFKVGTFSFGGGLTLIAFIQAQVVDQYHWLTHQEFIDGLALGQFTPGPILMLSSYVGYKIAGIIGAAVGALAIFLPSFIIMLSVLPVLERFRNLRWMKAAMQGIAPAVIGVLTVSILQLAPHAVPDLTAGAIFCGTVIAMLAWRLATMKLLFLGALIGIIRNRWFSLPGLR
ncbi:MAG: chromate efflux transporter [Pseudomonadota bacterium]